MDVRFGVDRCECLKVCSKKTDIKSFNVEGPASICCSNFHPNRRRNLNSPSILDHPLIVLVNDAVTSNTICCQNRKKHKHTCGKLPMNLFSFVRLPRDVVKLSFIKTRIRRLTITLILCLFCIKQLKGIDVQIKTNFIYKNQ